LSTYNNQATVHLTHSRVFSLLYCLALLAFPITGQGNTDSALTEKQLNKLRQEIRSVQQDLDKTRSRRDIEQTKLKDTEKTIGEILTEIRNVNQTAKQENQKLSDLRKKEKKLNHELKQQSDTLDAQIRTAYTMGRQEYLKILLNQQHPADVSRALTYLRYLNQARNERIEAVKGTLNKLGAVRQNISEKTQALEALRAERTSRKRDLDEALKKHQWVLAELNQDVKDKSEKLSQLKKNEAQLESLLSRLQGLVQVPEIESLEGRFGRQKGRLRLPISGKISAHYGSPKNLGNLRWKGLFLANKTGTEVKSIFRGRVAYADWLRGFGLLLIIDHGDGFMSLYGHNQSLYKEIGDWVETGHTVASSGNTGSPPQPGLYFEIRQNGQPRDPLDWCKRR